MFLERTRYWLAAGIKKTVLIFSSRNEPLSIGARGEKLAQQFLRKRRYQILESGFSDYQGEIDIVAVDRNTIVFVEVKTRATDLAGDPASAVDEIKQAKIVRTAKSYLRHYRLDEYSVRFDVIGILWADSDEKPQIEHLIGAFQDTDVGC